MENGREDGHCIAPVADLEFEIGCGMELGCAGIESRFREEDGIGCEQAGLSGVDAAEERERVILEEAGGQARERKRLWDVEFGLRKRIEKKGCLDWQTGCADQEGGEGEGFSEQDEARDGGDGSSSDFDCGARQDDPVVGSVWRFFEAKGKNGACGLGVHFEYVAPRGDGSAFEFEGGYLLGNGEFRG